VPQANTTAVVLTNSGMSHMEGGWPKEVDHTEAEQVIRFRRKVEKDEDYIRQVVRLGAVVEDLVKQNNAIDIYEQYFEGKWVLGVCPTCMRCWHAADVQPSGCRLQPAGNRQATTHHPSPQTCLKRRCVSRPAPAR
jgi:hypothetical protein